MEALPSLCAQGTRTVQKLGDLSERTGFGNAELISKQSEVEQRCRRTRNNRAPEGSIEVGAGPPCFLLSAQGREAGPRLCPNHTSRTVSYISSPLPLSHSFICIHMYACVCGLEVGVASGDTGGLEGAL